MLSAVLDRPVVGRLLGKSETCRASKWPSHPKSQHLQPSYSPVLTEASILFNNSFVLRSRCQRQTTTRSCSGSIQIVFEPAPSAAKLVRGVLGHCLPCVFNHQR